MESRAWGLLILLVGAVLLLGNFGVIPEYSIGELIRNFWPALLIYWGLYGIICQLRGGAYSSWFGSLFLIVLGAGILASNLGYLEVSFWGLLFPAALVIAGLAMLFGKKPSARVITSISYDHEGEPKQYNYEYKYSADTEQKKERIRERHLTKRKIKSLVGDMRVGGPNYKLEDMLIDLKAGNIVVDLRETFIPDGETVVDVECKAGDVNIWLPEGLAVSVEADVMFGQVAVMQQHQTNGTAYFVSENYDEAERKVRVLVHVKFGDIDVKAFG